MKFLILFAVAALVAAEAEPEADPQLLLNAGLPISPFARVTSVETEEVKPITYTIPSAYPFAGMPYMYNNYNTWPFMFPMAAKPAEAARAKREAEADPQFFMNPLVSFNADDTPLPLTYSFPTVDVPAISPVTYSAGAWPAAWSGAWPYHGFPIAYSLAKKTE